LGLALHQYHDTYNVLPPGWLADEPLGEPGWGWTTHLLAYVEQRNVDEGLINRHLAIADAANQKARETVMPLVLCPSDPAPKLFALGGGEGNGSSTGAGDGGGGGERRRPPPRPVDSKDGSVVILDDEEPEDPPMDDGGTLFLIARSNYVGVFGTLEIEENAAAADGVFFFQSRTRFAQVTDGLSNTIMIGERRAKRGGSLWQGVVKLANAPIQRIVGVADHPPN
jgi:hypothetical protein